MKLIPEAKKAHKYWSVKFSGLAAVSGLVELSNLFGLILPIWQPVLPESTFAILTAVFSTLAFISRYIQQKGVKDAE